jgi:uncharacterized protein with HEPN domain
MQHSVKTHLIDILNAIDSIYDYLGEERSLTTYESNKLLRRAVERELEIIGEAVGRILKRDPEIDNVIIWGIINKDLPMLREQVLDLLEKKNS